MGKVENSAKKSLPMEHSFLCKNFINFPMWRKKCLIFQLDSKINILHSVSFENVWHAFSTILHYFYLSKSAWNLFCLIFRAKWSLQFLKTQKPYEKGYNLEINCDSSNNKCTISAKRYFSRQNHTIYTTWKWIYLFLIFPIYSKPYTNANRDIRLSPM